MSKMKTFTHSVVALSLALGVSFTVQAGEADFQMGPVFTDMGAVAAVETDHALGADDHFAIAYDTAKGATPGEINKTLNTAARFINMHVSAGVPKDNLKVAIVIHGKATFDVTQDAFYGSVYPEAENINASAVTALREAGVRIIVCGQSAAYYDVKKSTLLPGVEMHLSAMTAHAQLQQAGYTLNPF